MLFKYRHNNTLPISLEQFFIFLSYFVHLFSIRAGYGCENVNWLDIRMKKKREKMCRAKKKTQSQIK